ncbi:YtrH family sporulation protein [Ammoniphilus sp. YIM 78166]|uniref:YtrH family sporulation protein n=1 Tax=Ammoniphilus sp. YIM 78166 TaxID=1644106 RepID=UPI00107040F4|nr:YtrH family sporulation protein [Ammoniphilus sp. YIM 78166]
MTLLANVILHFFIAFGIVVGGSFMGAMGSFLVRQPPLSNMVALSEKLKIWGLVGALGGTFDSFMQIERVFSDGQLSDIIKQIILIISAFAGAYSGYVLIKWLGKLEG